jgi:glycosyltransferase involved in cell wall biosynthesis
MKLSIVMTYHNRPDQLHLTLRSIFAQEQDVEIIIVDDASDEGLGARTVLEGFQLDGLEIKVLEISKEEKNWINPSVPYNRGFEEITGDVVVIQNAECAHVGPVLQQMRSRVKDVNYVVCPCYSSTESEFNQFKFLSTGNPGPEIDSIVTPHKESQWYHHPDIFPKWYHFCSGITLKNLERLGGFNEAFAFGYCFEDNDFLLRIRKKLKLSLESTDHNSYVVHQWHPKNAELHGGCPLWERNRILFMKMQEALR